MRRMRAARITRGTGRPTCTSFRPILNLPSAATRWSQKMASTAPPAGLWPVMAAATGTGESAMLRSRSKKSPQRRFMVARSWPKSSGTSRPPLYMPGEPEITMALAPDFGACSMAARKACTSPWLRALAGGRSRRISRIPSCSIFASIVFLLVAFGLHQFPQHRGGIGTGRQEESQDQSMGIRLLPGQFAHRQPEGPAHRIHAGFLQTPGQLPMGLRRGLFQSTHLTAAHRFAAPPQHAGGMHVALREPRGQGAVARIAPEYAVAAIQHQHFAREQRVPVAGAHPLREQGVEYQAAGGGQQQAAQPPVMDAPSTHQHGFGFLDVGAAVAE